MNGLTDQSHVDMKAALLDVCNKHSVQRAALFGSVARGEDGPESDIDLLVELKEGQTLFDLIGLKQDLERSIDRKVDVVTYASLHPLLKDRILAEQEVLL